MRKLLIPLSLLVALSYSFQPARADDPEWLTEEQMQNMSIAELQAWASKTEKSVKTSGIYEVKPKKSRIHMERRLGYHPLLAENSPDVPLRDELHPTTTTPTRPDGGKSSAFPEPSYYDDVAPRESNGIVDGVKKVVSSPVTVPTHLLKHVGKGVEKVLWFIDERVPWI